MLPLRQASDDIERDFRKKDWPHVHKDCSVYSLELDPQTHERLCALARDPQPDELEPTDQPPLPEAPATSAAPETLSRDVRNRHVYIIGKTRMGKSVTMRSMILADIERGDGAAFIDPHGDTAESLSHAIPQNRTHDVYYFDPTSKTCPPFNLLALRFDPPKLAEDIVSAFNLMYGDSWGPRLDHLLRNALLTLLADREPHSLTDVRRLLLEDGYRSSVLRSITNDDLLSFWDYDFPKDAKSSVPAVLNKFSVLLAPGSALARLCADPRNALDFSDILNHRKILLVNLSKGKLGDAPSRLLGAFFVTAISQSALARADLPMGKRADFYLFVDEFHNYAVASIETILSESAKYRLNLTLANQSMTQLPSAIRDAILGNVGTIIAFQVSSTDTPRLTKEIAGTITTYFLEPAITDTYRHQVWSEWRDRMHRARPIARDILTENVRAFPAHQHAKPDQVVYRITQLGLERFCGSRSDFPGSHDYYRNHPPMPRYLDKPTLAPPGPLRQVTHTYRWPSEEDLQNLPPLHAAMRVGSPSNVHKVVQTIPTPPTSDSAPTILAHMTKLSHPLEEPIETSPPPMTSEAHTPQPAEPQPEITDAQWDRVKADFTRAYNDPATTPERKSQLATVAREIVDATEPDRRTKQLDAIARLYALIGSSLSQPQPPQPPPSSEPKPPKRKKIFTEDDFRF
jgi:hypothetical protein